MNNYVNATRIPQTLPHVRGTDYDDMHMIQTREAPRVPTLTLHKQDMNIYQLFALFDNPANHDVNSLNRIYNQCFAIPLACVTFGMIEEPFLSQATQRNFYDGNNEQLPSGVKFVL